MYMYMYMYTCMCSYLIPMGKTIQTTVGAYVIKGMRSVCVSCVGGGGGYCFTESYNSGILEFTHIMLISGMAWV